MRTGMIVAGLRRIMKLHMTRKRRWLISGIIACLGTLAASFQEERPRIQTGDTSFDYEQNEWVVSGSYRFTRLDAGFSSRVFGLHRTGEFHLRIPDDGKRDLSSTEYEAEAIAQARENAGRWRLNIFVFLFNSVVATPVIRFLWWLFQKKDNRTKPSKATLKSAAGAASEAAQR